MNQVYQQQLLHQQQQAEQLRAMRVSKVSLKKKSSIAQRIKIKKNMTRMFKFWTEIYFLKFK